MWSAGNSKSHFCRRQIMVILFAISNEHWLMLPMYIFLTGISIDTTKVVLESSRNSSIGSQFYFYFIYIYFLNICCPFATMGSWPACPLVNRNLSSSKLLIKLIIQPEVWYFWKCRLVPMIEFFNSASFTSHSSKL